MYEVLLPSGRYNAYCEMWLADGGYTFLPVQSIAKLTQEDMKHLLSDTKNVLMRIVKPDGTQPYTHIQPLRKSDTFRVHLHPVKPDTYYPKAVNSHLGPNLLLETMHGKVTAGRGEFGFLSNSKKVSYLYTYKGTEANIFNYFAFFSNPKELKPSDYLIDDPEYETRKVAVEWRGTARRPYSTRRMPVEYFMLTELHYMWGGAYTTSDRWINSANAALGTAVGFR